MNARYFALAACLIFSGLCPIAQAETLMGWVTRITDGDSITVQGYSNRTYQVHLLGIAAPEIYQAAGKHSQQILGALVYGRDVAVEWQKRDGSGHLLGKVMVAPVNAPCGNQRHCPKTLDAGLEQIQSGQAQWDRRYAKEQTPEDQAKYRQAEFEAKSQRKGLWRETNPAAP